MAPAICMYMKLKSLFISSLRVSSKFDITWSTASQLDLLIFAETDPETSKMSIDIVSHAGGYDAVVSRNRGLGCLFHDQVKRAPHAIAVTDGSTSFTYKQLHNQAVRLARELSLLSLSFEEPVGIVAQHGVGDVVAQLGIIYAGGTCVPMDPASSDSRIKNVLSKLQTRCILTDEENAHRDLPFHRLIITGLDASALEPCSTVRDVHCDAPSPGLTTTGLDKYMAGPAPTTLSHCTHLIHTSGTTGPPKAVRIAARSILHVAHHAPYTPLLVSDTVAHGNLSSFDVSLFDIWAPLILGARIVVLSKAVMLDPPTLADHIAAQGITVMATTAPLLALIASTYPRAMEKLRVCLIGGEAANVAAMGTILREGPPGMLVNAYGPTECCAFCLAREVTLQDVRAEVISIGEPIGRNVVYVAGEDGEESEEGELWVGGPCVSLGYVKQAEKNAEVFKERDGVRMYCTGDVVRRQADGQILYVGRKDHQVKIRGFRVELEAVECALLATGEYTEAVAMKIEAPQEGAGSMLVAYVVPVAVSALLEPGIGDRRDSSVNELFLGQLAGQTRASTTKAIHQLRESLPDYMIPQIQLIAAIPLNAHAKIDRNRLSSLYHERWQMTLSGVDPLSHTTQWQLSHIWNRILGLPINDGLGGVGKSDDFFALGGTSLQAALLIAQIRRTFGVHMSLLTLYNHSSLRALSAAIQDRPDGVVVNQRGEMHTWLADTRLADGLACPAGCPVDWTLDTEGRVFLTGGTGFVGAFMLADLLRLHRVRQVACLVRAGDAGVGLQRLRGALAKYGLWEAWFERKLIVLPGRLEDEFLGLGRKRFEETAAWASVVFHLGAHVNYTQPYSLHRPANILGTVNVVRFACCGRKKGVHYMSSISCFGPTGMVTGVAAVAEDAPLLDHVEALVYDHGYSQSQWAVEELLRGLMGRRFPIAVYRPGFITGHSKSGVCNPDDFLSRHMLGCLEMGCYPKLPDQRKEFVPVDYVNAAFVHIAASPTSLGRAFHLVPPARQLSIDMDSTMDMVGQCSGTPLQAIAYTDWIKRLAEDPPRRLQPLQPMLEETIRDGLTRWELYEKMPVYKAVNTANALASHPEGLQFPVLSPDMMRRYLGYLQRSP